MLHQIRFLIFIITDNIKYDFIINGMLASIHITNQLLNNYEKLKDSASLVLEKPKASGDWYNSTITYSTCVQYLHIVEMSTWCITNLLQGVLVA